MQPIVGAWHHELRAVATAAISVRHFSKASLLAACGLCLSLNLPFAAHGQLPIDWTNSGTGNYRDENNWAGFSVPEESDQFVIDNGGTAQLSGTAKAFTGFLGDGSGSSGALHILAGGNLEVIRPGGGFGLGGEFLVGDSGTGVLHVATGGQMTNVNLLIGTGSGSVGTVLVAGGAVTSSEHLYVGDRGTGNLTISDGGIVSSQNALIGNEAGSSGTVEVSSGALNNSQTLTIGAAGSGTLTVSSLGSVTSGSATLGDAAGSAGSLTINGGSWTNSGDFFAGRSGSGAIAINDGGVLAVGGNAFLSYGATASGKATITNGHWSVGSFLTIGQNAAGSVTVEASGTLTAAAVIVSGDSGSADSTLTINGGTVVAGQIAGLSNAKVAFTGGTLQFTQDNPDYFISLDDGDVTLNGSAVTFDTQHYHVATDVVLSGTARLIKTGGGRLGLSAANTYSGGTFLQAGEILINNNTSIGSGTLAINTAELRSTADVTLSPSLIAVNANHVAAFSTAAATTLTLDVAAFELGEEAMFRIGSPGNTGTVVFNADLATALQPGTGTISVGFGTLRAGNEQLASLASQVEKVFIVNGATLDFNDQTVGGNVNALFGEGTLHTGTQSATTVTVLSGTFAGQISGEGSLVKAGSGGLTLSGLQTFTGSTTVSAGTLTVSGEIGDVTIAAGTLLVSGNAADITVNAGGILMGSGTVQGIGLNGGILAPGQSPGTLSAFALEWVGGTMQFELGSTPLLSDHLALIGTLSGIGGQYDFHFLDQGAVVGATYDLISFQGSTISIGDFGLTNTDGFAGNFSYNNTDTVLQFTVTAVPEPGTLTLAGLGVLLSLLRRRKRCV